MNGTLKYLLVGTRGGYNRAQILHALEDRPRNINQIAESLGLHYKTVRYHLEVLEDNNVVEKSGGDYGAVYLPTDRIRHQWDECEELLQAVE